MLYLSTFFLSGDFWLNHLDYTFVISLLVISKFIEKACACVQ